MKRILITGNAGYIGSHLTKMLGSDYEIYGLDINESQMPVIVQIQHDINLLNHKISTEFDAVVHLAALVNVSESDRNPADYYTTNINGTLNILNNITFKNFVFASTGSAENCVSPYGVSKRAAEDCVQEYCEKSDLQYTIFRFYNVIGSDGFGPTNPDGLMLNLMKAANVGEFTIFGRDYETTDGTCVRDYVHVNEICDAIRAAIESPANQIECLGHGVGYTVREIVNMFEDVNNLAIDIKYGPRRKGDLAYSVLEETSRYMKNLYNIEELLKL